LNVSQLSNSAVLEFQSTSTVNQAYCLVQLRNGVCSVRSLADDETFHPGIGPALEAESLYARQLRLAERAREIDGEFVIWDVGLGAAANAVTAIRVIRDSASEKARTLRIISFDRTTAAAAFALQHAAELGYLDGFTDALAGLVHERSANFSHGHLHVQWSLETGDFPERLNDDPRLPPPHAILFDPHSPKRNPEMWTAELFADLFHALNPEQPCALATFSRSTLVRTAMLLGGFFVGVGRPSGLKEDTTVAANTLSLLDEPLDQRWLESAARSDSAEPLHGRKYVQRPLHAETLRQLRNHPQFQGDRTR
jgi:tRNA U34 5-methylaminomethyl-2-thiouridine-forming methyltransferase MnmC